MSARAFSAVTNIIIVNETSDKANITYSGGPPSKKFANRRDGVVVRASASQSVDLGFNPLVESYRKT